MPVVINEFEIVPAAEPTKEPSPAAATEKQAATSAAPPREIDRVLRRLRERAMRLRAH